MSFVATGLAREIEAGTPPAPRTLWEGVSLSVEPGEVLFVVGPSGTGKSLLLRCLAGLDRLKAGTLTLAGKTPAELGGYQHWRTEVLYCSQARWAFSGSPASTFEDVKHFAAQRGRAHAELEPLAVAVGLEPSLLTQAWPTLSGGQAARAALAISLALRPSVLLLDEPTAACDPVAAAKVEQALKASGAALVWVSHDPEQPRRVGGRVLPFPPSP